MKVEGARGVSVVVKRSLLVILVTTTCAAAAMQLAGDDTSPNGYETKAHAIRTGLWDLSGSAALESGDDYHNGQQMELTTRKEGDKGAVWSKAAIQPLDWEVRFWLAVQGDAEKPAKGMAFWYTKAPEPTGILYGSKEKFDGLGLLFDSFDDDKAGDNPIIMTWVNNGTKLFHHDTDGLGTRNGGCRAKYRNRKAPVGVMVQYKSTEKTLKVQLHMGGKAGWEPCVAKDDIELHDKGYFGFSAANKKDAAGDEHKIVALKMWDLKKEDDDEEQEEETEKKQTAAEERKPGKQTHQLVETVKLKGKDLQDQLLENLAAQVKRDRKFKIEEFGVVHTQLNEAVSDNIFGPTADTLKDLDGSVKKLSQAGIAMHEQMSITAREMSAPTAASDDDTQPAVNGLHDALEEMRNEFDRLKAELHTDRMPKILETVEASSKFNDVYHEITSWGMTGWSPIWYGIMCFQILLIVGLFYFKSKPARRQVHSVGSMGGGGFGGAQSFGGGYAGAQSFGGGGQSFGGGQASPSRSWDM